MSTNSEIVRSWYESPNQESLAPDAEMLDAGDFIVALGHYSGRAKLTETAFTCPFVHIWKLSNGKIVQFRQSADTLLIARALSVNETASVHSL